MGRGCREHPCMGPESPSGPRGSCQFCCGRGGMAAWQTCTQGADAYRSRPAATLRLPPGVTGRAEARGHGTRQDDRPANRGAPGHRQQVPASWKSRFVFFAIVKYEMDCTVYMCILSPLCQSCESHDVTLLMRRYRGAHPTTRRVPPMVPRGSTPNLQTLHPTLS